MDHDEWLKTGECSLEGIHTLSIVLKSQLNSKADNYMVIDRQIEIYDKKIPLTLSTTLASVDYTIRL